MNIGRPEVVTVLNDAPSANVGRSFEYVDAMEIPDATNPDEFGWPAINEVAPELTAIENIDGRVPVNLDAIQYNPGNSVIPILPDAGDMVFVVEDVVATPVLSAYIGAPTGLLDIALFS